MGYRVGDRSKLCLRKDTLHFSRVTIRSRKRIKLCVSRENTLDGFSGIAFSEREKLWKCWSTSGKSIVSFHQSF